MPIPLASMVRIFVGSARFIQALEFLGHLIEEDDIHLMIQKAVHFQDIARLDHTVFPDPFFQ
mgnify:CR=1 FL=1